jgi:hypothetical protein
MPTITLLIVSNSCNWQSWPQKIDDLTAFFKSVCTLDITVQQTSFTNIPFLTFAPTLTTYENFPAGAKVMEVNETWYEQNVLPLAKGYDIVLFTLPLSTWPLNDIVRGVTQLATKNPVQIQVAADENEAVYVNMQKLFDSFEHYAEHEIMHALFALSKATDTTHYWDFAKGNLAGALADLHLTANLPTQTLLEFLFAKLSALLEKIKQLRTMPQNTTPAEQNTTPAESTSPKPISDAVDTLLPWIDATGSENNRHNVRVLCDLAGLDLIAKNTITACIEQESDFWPRAVGKPNANGTIDYGICQFNNGELHGVPLWIGAGAAFASVDEVLNNPQKCVELMISEYKAGHINWWSSYSTGAYKQFMPQG